MADWIEGVGDSWRFIDDGKWPDNGPCSGVGF